MMWELLTGEVPYKGIDDVAIAYGVATDKYELHIPSTCPEQWRDLMKSCWSYQSDTRPSFRDILKTLDDIARTDFHQMPNDNFYSLQEDWKAEIDDRLQDIRLKEDVRNCYIEVYLLGGWVTMYLYVPDFAIFFGSTLNKSLYISMSFI